jgi:hypothetical protein
VRGRCAQCGFDASTVSVSDAVVSLRSFPRRWRAAFALLDEDDDDVLRRRPSPEVWSALEYAAHTRDSISINGWAMATALREDHPVLEWPGGADADIPASEAPDAATALDGFADACEKAAAKAQRTDAGSWRRPATLRGGRDEEVDALWFLHHCVHEGSHHLKDVHRVLAAVRGRPA